MFSGKPYSTQGRVIASLIFFSFFFFGNVSSDFYKSRLEALEALCVDSRISMVILPPNARNFHVLQYPDYKPPRTTPTTQRAGLSDQKRIASEHQNSSTILSSHIYGPTSCVPLPAVFPSLRSQQSPVLQLHSVVIRGSRTRRLQRCVESGKLHVWP
ncbi:hypothetical protein C8R43DRAFT_264868 [Mycena crocata]|nr:hypothetical protein C8R43DRAFT_264868 [Mycena crocata]